MLPLLQFLLLFYENKPLKFDYMREIDFIKQKWRYHERFFPTII